MMMMVIMRITRTVSVELSLQIETVSRRTYWKQQRNSIGLHVEKISMTLVGKSYQQR